MKALVFGDYDELIEAVPALLFRAGFKVCLVTTSFRLSKCKFIDRFLYVGSSDELLQRANDEARDSYDLIIASDEGTIDKVINSNLSLNDKTRLLAITSSDGLEHIGSKIGLSNVLKRNNIITPAFAVGRDLNELIDGCKKLGFPLFVKLDSGSAGAGVYHCSSERDIARHVDNFTYPVLIQKEIDGQLLDLSGFFRDGQLICFSYSQILAARGNGYGPSSVRKYRSLSSVDVDVFDKLRDLGRALGAHGFANISCILSKHDSELYFFEADMRPNVWIEYPKYFGEDPAIKIRNYFLRGEILNPGTVAGDRQQITLYYLPRMSSFDILVNRHDCRSFYENYASRRILAERAIGTIKQMLLTYIKPSVSPTIWRWLKRFGERSFDSV